MDKDGITSLYLYISVDLAHHEIFRAKGAKGGINVVVHILPGPLRCGGNLPSTVEENYQLSL